jgi:toxin CptA
MSSAGFGRSLSIEPRTSRLLTASVILLHAGAFASVLTLPVSRWATAALALAIAASCVLTLAGPVFRLRASSIVMLEWRADGRWWVRRRDGGGEDVALLPDSYVHPWLVVLNFRRAGDGRRARWRRFAAAPSARSLAALAIRGRCSVVLPPDSVDRETLRRLRARLRHEGGAAGSGPR